MKILHKYSDGSTLVQMSIHDILSTPVWKGNRIMDIQHVQKIKDSLNQNSKTIKNLDSGYHIIKYLETDAAGNQIEQAYLLDGQHRRSVVESEIMLCEDFPVTCIITHVESEIDAIRKFNEINCSKPIYFEEDISMIINRFLESLLIIFGGKKNMIRSSSTSRPYCSVEEIRRVMMTMEDAVRSCRSVKHFMKNVIKWNERRVSEIQLELTGITGKTVRDENIKSRAVKLGFALAVVNGLPWIEKCLKE